MSYHIRDLTKMISDTPRTEAEVNRTHGPLDGIVTVDADFACMLERELNAANAIIRQQQLLEEENDAANAEIERLTNKVAQLYEGAEEQKQRINQLQIIISRAACAYFRDGSYGQVASGMLAILEEGRKP